MLPTFPTSKKLEISDKAAVNSYLQGFPLYSDFEFESLWSWDVKEEMRLSELNNNLVIEFTDYTTGEPFLTFVGDNDVNETAQTLLHSPLYKDTTATLHIVPEIVAQKLNQSLFTTTESRDHFDYILDLSNHLEYPGSALKAHRKLFRQFKEHHPEFTSIQLDMTLPETQKEVADLYRKWDENKGFLTTSEAFAYERFLAGASELSYSAVGIVVGGNMVAFHIVSLPPGDCASALFSKADIQYRGVYAALDSVVAIDLLERGYTHLNIQQDLGIEALRNAKEALAPVKMLKKYSVTLKQ